jgi:hypothetical protein
VLVTRVELVAKVAGHLHAEQHIDGARLVAAYTAEQNKEKLVRVDSMDVSLQFLNSLLFWCLNNRRKDLAAQMLWSENLFTFKPRSTQLIWNEIEQSSSLMLMGAGSMSKSYAGGVWFLLDWIWDPEYTSISLVGPTEDHLKDNLFTHIVTLHRQASLPLPGRDGDLFLGLDPRSRKGAIRGIIMPLGQKKAGRLQGRKRVQRKKPHPIFGPQSRMRIFLDELEKIPTGVWGDIDNVFTNLGTDAEGFKIIGAFNPEDPQGQVAVRCEPQCGWEGFNPETDEQWTSKRGWRVLRLDAAKCENVVEKKVIFPGLQTYEGFNRIIENAGGIDTPGYWTMARACFPRTGAVYTVIPGSMLFKLKAEFIFAEPPTNVGAADLALEGGDAAEMAVGRFGRIVGIKFPPSLDFPQGREIRFKDAEGAPRLRWGLQVDQLFPLEQGDTLKIAEQVKTHCIRFGIAPGWLMLDRTGNGAGVHDVLKGLWSEEVRGTNYSEAATETKILQEDTKTPKEEYDKVTSELWFAFKKWSEFNMVKVLPSMETEELFKELGGRRYMPGKTTRVESKKDYKSRGNKSPNKADAVTLLVQCARLASGVVPSALDDAPGVLGNFGQQSDGRSEHRVDETNRFDDLDSPQGDGDLYD